MKKREIKAKKSVKTGGKKTAKKPVKEKEVKTKKKTTVKKQAETKKEVKKPVKKPATKKPEKKVKEKAKKITPKKKITKAPKIEKVSKKEPKKVALPKKKLARMPVRTIKAIEKRAETPIAKPAEPGKKYPVAARKILSAEYGEDRITLMTVDPWKLFAYWEVRENTLAKVKGTLVLRVYDVTGIDFDDKNANIVFDIAAHERVGDSYIGVGPEREFIVDIGSVSMEGDFITIARSNKVSTPPLKVAKEEGVLPQEMYEAGHVVGYF